MAKATDGEILATEFSTKCSLKTKEIAERPLEFIPLLLCDILRSKSVPSSSPNIFKIFDDRLLFRTMIVHGRVVGKIAPTRKSGHYRFEIDDCTAVLPVVIWQRQDDIAEIKRLQTEISARRFWNKERKDLMDALQRILVNSETESDPSRISIGCKLFIFGRPDFFRNQISICAYSWDLDNDADRYMELAFKDELIEWYLKRYRPLAQNGIII